MESKPIKLMKYQLDFLVNVRSFVEEVARDTHTNPQEQLDKLASGEQSIPGAWAMIWDDILLEIKRGLPND